MSPTQIAITEARLNRELEAARQASDIPAMQRVLASLTALYRSRYGQP